MLEMLICIGLGVISSFVYAIFSDFIDYLFVYRKSEFTGYWRNSILDVSGQELKVDYCHLLHNKRNGIIKGKIIREVPEQQNYRKWYCNGVLIKEKIIMSFWSANDSQKSDGSGYLFLMDDKRFEGVYMHGTRENNIETVKVMSEKIKDIDKIKRVKKQFKSLN